MSSQKNPDFAATLVSPPFHYVEPRSIPPVEVKYMPPASKPVWEDLPPLPPVSSPRPSAPPRALPPAKSSWGKYVLPVAATGIALGAAGGLYHHLRGKGGKGETKTAATRLSKIIRKGGAEAEDLMAYLKANPKLRSWASMAEGHQVPIATSKLDFKFSRGHKGKSTAANLHPGTSASELVELAGDAATSKDLVAALTHPNAPPELLAWGEQHLPGFAKMPVLSAGLPHIPLDSSGAPVKPLVEGNLELAKLMSPAHFEEGSEAVTPLRLAWTKDREAHPLRRTRARKDYGDFTTQDPGLATRMSYVQLPDKKSTRKTHHERLALDAVDSLQKSTFDQPHGESLKGWERPALLTPEHQAVLADRRAARRVFPEHWDLLKPTGVEETSRMAEKAKAVDLAARRDRFRKEDQRLREAHGDHFADRWAYLDDAPESFLEGYHKRQKAREDAALNPPPSTPRPAPERTRPLSVAPVAAPPPPVAAPPPPVASDSEGIPGWGKALLGVGGAGTLAGAAYLATRDKKHKAEETKTADVSGTRPQTFNALPIDPKKRMTPPSVKQATMNLTGKDAPKAPAVKLADAYFALGTKYPLTSMDQVKMASAYFEENARAFTPEERREFAYNLCKRAEELGFPEWLGEEARAYGGDPVTDLDQIKQAFHARQEFLPERGVRLLDTLEPKLAYLSPQDRYEALSKIDQGFGMERLYGRFMDDPYRSLTQKWASDAGFSDEVAGIVVLESELRHLAAQRKVLRENFSDDIADRMAKDPVGTFKSLSPELKVLMARCSKAASGDAATLSTLG